MMAPAGPLAAVPEAAPPQAGQGAAAPVPAAIGTSAELSIGAAAAGAMAAGLLPASPRMAGGPASRPVPPDGLVAPQGAAPVGNLPALPGAAELPVTLPADGPALPPGSLAPTPEAARGAVPQGVPQGAPPADPAVPVTAAPTQWPEDLAPGEADPLPEEAGLPAAAAPEMRGASAPLLPAAAAERAGPAAGLASAAAGTPSAAAPSNASPAAPAQAAGPAGALAPPVPPRTVPLAPAQQVVPVAIALSLLPGERASLRVALEPPELGRVEVRIARGADGGDAVRILAERPETLALLQRDQRELGRALDQAGVAAGGGISFGLSAQDGGGSGGAPQRDARGEPGGRAAPGQGLFPGGVSTPATVQGRPVAGLSLLDIAV